MKPTPSRIVFALLAAAPLAASAVIVPSDFDRTFSVTFGGYAGSEPLANFPALVRLSPSVIPGFSYADFQTLDENDVPTGADLRFADEFGNELAFEIDTWNPAGESLVWVKVPQLSSDTTIHVYYGQENATIPTSSTDGSVWSGGYIGVWHMNPDLADATGHALGATSTGYAADAGGAVGAAFSTTAATGHGISVPDYSAFGPTTASSFTVSGWFRPANTTFGQGRRIFSRKNTYQDKNGFEIYLNNDGSLVVRGANSASGSGYGFSGPTLSTDAWVHYTMQFSGTTVTAYANGVALTPTSTSGMSAPTSNDKALGIGNYYNRTGAGTFPGAIDEVRLLDGLVTADRAAADYATVADPAFASYSTVTSTTGGAALPIVSVSSASNIGAYAATANGSLVSAGVAPCIVTIEWGVDPDNLSTTQTVGTLTAAQDFSFPLTTQPSTTYYYRFHVVDGAASEATTVTASFTTTPFVTAVVASDIAAFTATANGALVAADNPPCVVTIEWGEDPEDLATTQTVGTFTESQDFSFALSTQPGTTYYYRFRAVDALMNEETTEVVSVTTLSGYAVFAAPTLTDASTPEGEGGEPAVFAATAAVELTDPGTGVATVELFFGTNPDALELVRTWEDVDEAQTFTHTVTGLSGITAYYAQFRATVLDHATEFVTDSAVATTTMAGDVVWTGGTGAWLVAANWTPAVVPNATPVNATIDNDPGTASSVTLTLAENLSAGNIVVDAGDSLTVTKSGSSYRATFAGLDNAGIVKVQGQANGNAQTVTLKVAGEGAFRNAEGARIEVNGSNARNRTATRFEFAAGAVNDGTITLTQPASDRNNGMITLTNQGTYENNGEIRIELTGEYSKDGTYARLHLAETASNALSEFAGTGRVVLVEGERTAEMLGAVGISVESSGSDRYTHTLTNGVNHTIEGVGGIGHIAIVNNGLLRATGESIPLSISPFYRHQYGKIMANTATGRIVAAGPAGLYIGYNGSHASCFQNEGLLETRSGSFIEIRSYCTAQDSTSDTPAATLNLGGTLAGGGRFVAHRPVVLGDGARLSPGDLANSDGTGTSTAGTLTVTTNLTLSAETVLDFQFGRCEAGQYDSVVVEGGLTLGGTLRASALGSARPSGTYRIFTCAPGELTGDASSLTVLTTGDLHEPSITVDADAGTVDAYFPPSETVILIR